MVDSYVLRRKVVSHVLGLQSIISILYILDLIDIVYYATIHRLTYSKEFDLGLDPFNVLLVALVFWMVYVFSRGWRREAVVLSCSLLLALYSAHIAVAVTLVLYSILITYKEGYHAEFLESLVLILTVFYSLTLVHWLILYPLGVDSFLTFFADLEVKLFHLGNYVAPLLALALFSIWFFRPYLNKVIPSEPRNYIEDNVKSRYLLSLSLIIGVVSAFYPYLKSINPNGVLVGVDAYRYVRILEEIEGMSKILSLSSGSRPFFYICIKVFQALTFSSIEDAVKFFPVVLIPLFVLSTYFLVQRVSGNDVVAGWAAFLAATGSRTVVGLYSYFLSNLLAIILIQFSIGFLFTALGSGRRLPLIVSSFLASLCLFTHPWTFDQYVAAVAVLTVILVYRLYRGDEVKEVIIILLVFLGVQLGAEAIKILFLNSYSASDAITGTLVKGLELKLWYTSIFTFRLLYGGYLSNNVPIVLAIIGAYSLNEHELKHRYFIIFMALTFLGFLVTNETLKSRLFYNIPLEYLASLGFAPLLGKVVRGKGLETFLVVSSLVFLFRSLANLI